VDKKKALTLAVYAGVLFACLGLTPLWLDEIQQFANSRQTTVSELIRWVQLNAGASPLPYLIQHVFSGWFGYSPFAARFPAALCSVLSGVVFAAICPRFLNRGCGIALMLFLMLPLQFRYGLEGRVYSQGLFLSLLTLWLFFRLQERFSATLAISYGLAIAAGMYSQPLTLFPVLAQIPLVQRPAAISGGFAIASYVPWYLAQHRAQVQYAQLVPPTPFFSLKQIDPRILLHDLTGGGYVTTVVLVGLAIWGIACKSRTALLIYTLTAAVVGPILMDAVFNYFFAPRQVLYAMPSLVLLAARGFERLRAESRPAVAWASVVAFLSAAVVADYRQATTPRDDLAATADAIAVRLKSGRCALAVPREQIAFYSFLRPELNDRVCASNYGPDEIVAATSQYTTAAERESFVSSISERYQPDGAEHIGRSEITVYRRR
jgi:hypothetical protein